MSEEHAQAHPNYIRLYFILLALLVVSVLGPLLEIRAVTLTTAFGIALVKAYLVARNFMHLYLEPRIATYLLTTALAFMLLFFAGVSPDVMQHSGDNWVKPDFDPHVEMQADHGDHP